MQMWKNIISYCPMQYIESNGNLDGKYRYTEEFHQYKELIDTIIDQQ
jgi:hypothetical protein